MLTQIQSESFWTIYDECQKNDFYIEPLNARDRLNKISISASKKLAKAGLISARTIILLPGGNSSFWNSPVNAEKEIWSDINQQRKYVQIFITEAGDKYANSHPHP